MLTIYGNFQLQYEIKKLETNKEVGDPETQTIIFMQLISCG